MSFGSGRNGLMGFAACIFKLRLLLCRMIKLTIGFMVPLDSVDGHLEFTVVCISVHICCISQKIYQAFSAILQN